MSESGSEELEPELKDEMEDGQTVETLLMASAGLLRELGYTGPLSDADALLRSCEAGAECQLFTSLCVWLVSELKSVTPLVENVSPTEEGPPHVSSAGGRTCSVAQSYHLDPLAHGQPIIIITRNGFFSPADSRRGPADSETFQLEMSGVMSELHCPYAALTSGNVTTRLLRTATCLQLIVFLSTDLEAARLLKKVSVPTAKPVRHNEDVLEELQLIGKALDFPEISPDVPVKELMRELQNKVTERSGTDHMSPPLFKSQLQPEQWETLQELHYSMLKEYECRMRMLVTRFEVTVQSFHWSERAQVKEKAMNDVYWPLRKSLTAESRIAIPHLLAAREDYSRILHTCNATFCKKTRSAIQKVLMTGTVPDRGGRPNEIEPPMPMWEKRREGGGGHQRWGKRNKRKRN